MNLFLILSLGLGRERVCVRLSPPIRPYIIHEKYPSVTHFYHTKIPRELCIILSGKDAFINHFYEISSVRFPKKKKKKTISACEYVKVRYVFNLPKQTNFKRNFLVLSQSVIIYFFSSPSWASGGMAAVVMDLTLAIISLVCEINGWVIYWARLEGNSLMR